MPEQSFLAKEPPVDRLLMGAVLPCRSITRGSATAERVVQEIECERLVIRSAPERAPGERHLKESRERE